MKTCLNPWPRLSLCPLVVGYMTDSLLPASCLCCSLSELSRIQSQTKLQPHEHICPQSQHQHNQSCLAQDKLPDTLSVQYLWGFHNSRQDKMFTSNQLMMHAINTQTLLLFRTKGMWKENNLHTHTPVSTNAVTSLRFRPISCGSAAAQGVHASDFLRIMWRGGEFL